MKMTTKIQEKTTTTMEQQEMSQHEIPFEHKWILWCDQKDGKPSKNRKMATIKGSWNDGMNEVTQVRTVQEFWTLWRMLPKPSVIAKGNSFSFFHEGIQPTWEDEMNVGGGRWSLVVKNTSKVSGFNIADSIWLDTLLGVIGEQLGENVVGCVVNVRDGYDRISIWVSWKGCQQKSQLISIGHAWRLAISSSAGSSEILINFQLHRSVSFLETI